MTDAATPEGGFDLLDGISEDDRERLEHYLGRTTFSAGAWVVREGEHDRAFYLLREGTLEIVRGDEIVNVVEAPNVIGEIAFFDGSPRSGSVRARSDGHVDRVSRESFDAIAEERPELALALAQALGRLMGIRLRAIERRG